VSGDDPRRRIVLIAADLVPGVVGLLIEMAAMTTTRSQFQRHDEVRTSNGLAAYELTVVQATLTAVDEEARVAASRSIYRVTTKPVRNRIRRPVLDGSCGSSRG
jgi:hypothetical protein